MDRREGHDSWLQWPGRPRWRGSRERLGLMGRPGRSCCPGWLGQPRQPGRLGWPGRPDSWNSRLAVTAGMAGTPQTAGTAGTAETAAIARIAETAHTTGMARAPPQLRESRRPGRPGRLERPRRPGRPRQQGQPDSWDSKGSWEGRDVSTPRRGLADFVWKPLHFGGFMRSAPLPPPAKPPTTTSFPALEKTKKVENLKSSKIENLAAWVSEIELKRADFDVFCTY